MDSAASDGLVIVGTGPQAAIACECFRHDSPYEVAAVVVAFGDLAAAYPPSRYLAFAAASPAASASSAAAGNRVSGQLYAKLKAAGYSCPSYVSGRAYAARSASLGENTFVHAGAAVQHEATIGNNVVIGSGACVGHSAVIEDDCFVGPHVAIPGFCHIGRGSFLGANSCLADNIRIATDCVINPGAVILRNTEQGRAYTGNPARRVASA